MITSHTLIKTITRNRKRFKKTFINFIIAKKTFDGQHCKKLKIPFFIDCYNHYMNLIDVANQLRAIVIVHFSRNEKEFFLGMF
jgi:hypothetical protein